MLILISDENWLPREAETVNEMFSHGMERFHLRKPSASEEECRSFLSEITPQCLKQISVHQHHNLVNHFPEVGIHLKETDRIKTSVERSGGILSTSFHEMKNLRESIEHFDYAFLSPVFDSISKTGYQGRGFDVHDIEGTVIALGGVNTKNLSSVYSKGFSGAAILGAIWKSDDPLRSFLELQELSKAVEI